MKTNILTLLFVTGILAGALAQTTAPTPVAAPPGAPVSVVAPSPEAALKARRLAEEAGTAPDAVATPTAPAPGAVAPVAPVAAAVIPETPIASPANASGAPNFTNFQQIVQRNIFDPARRPYVRGVVQQVARYVPRVESFRFAGTGNKVDKGITAFFTGTGAPASCQLFEGDTINGFLIKKVTAEKVILADTKSTNSDDITLSVTGGMSRTDGGPWKWAVIPTSYSAPVRVARVQMAPDAGYTAAPVQDYSFQLPAGPQDFGGQFPNNQGFPGGATGRTRTRGGRNNGGGFGGAGFGAAADTTAPLSPAEQAAADAAAARLRARRAQEQ
jgi:hypothetical protein